MAHPYLKARTKQKWIESAKHLRIPPSPTVWACGFSRGSVKGTMITAIRGMISSNVGCFRSRGVRCLPVI